MEVIEANPSFKTDQCMGVLVGKFAVNYAVFDDKVASGKHSQTCIKPELNLKLFNFVS